MASGSVTGTGINNTDSSAGDASCESDPNFAVICGFLERFGVHCGLGEMDFLDLQEMIENTQEVAPELIDLHIKLLRKIRKSTSAERWERAVIKVCHTYNSQDAWEFERFGYKKAKLSSKLRLLKQLMEMQFDLNVKFKNEINKMSASDLRAQPLGRDKMGNAYWFHTDASCQIRVYKEDPDEETWQLVAKDRKGLVSLITALGSGEPLPTTLTSATDSATNEDSNSLEVVDKPPIILDTGQTSDSKRTSEDGSELEEEDVEEEEEEEEKADDGDSNEKILKDGKSNETKQDQKDVETKESAKEKDVNLAVNEKEKNPQELKAESQEKIKTEIKADSENENKPKLIIRGDKEEKTENEPTTTIVKEQKEVIQAEEKINTKNNIEPSKNNDKSPTKDAGEEIKIKEEDQEIIHDLSKNQEQYKTTKQTHDEIIRDKKDQGESIKTQAKVPKEFSKVDIKFPKMANDAKSQAKDLTTDSKNQLADVKAVSKEHSKSQFTAEFNKIQQGHSMAEVKTTGGYPMTVKSHSKNLTIIPSQLIPEKKGQTSEVKPQMKIPPGNSITEIKNQPKKLLGYPMSEFKSHPSHLISELKGDIGHSMIDHSKANFLINDPKSILSTNSQISISPIKPMMNLLSSGSKCEVKVNPSVTMLKVPISESLVPIPQVKGLSITKTKSQYFIPKMKDQPKGHYMNEMKWGEGSSHWSGPETRGHPMEELMKMGLVRSESQEGQSQERPEEAKPKGLRLKPLTELLSSPQVMHGVKEKYIRSDPFAGQMSNRKAVESYRSIYPDLKRSHSFEMEQPPNILKMPRLDRPTLLGGGKNLQKPYGGEEEDEDDPDSEVGDEIEEPLMLVTGRGSGEDNKCGNLKKTDQRPQSDQLCKLLNDFESVGDEELFDLDVVVSDHHSGNENSGETHDLLKRLCLPREYRDDYTYLKDDRFSMQKNRNYVSTALNTQHTQGIKNASCTISDTFLQGIKHQSTNNSGNSKLRSCSKNRVNFQNNLEVEICSNKNEGFVQSPFKVVLNCESYGLNFETKLNAQSNQFYLKHDENCNGNLNKKICFFNQGGESKPYLNSVLTNNNANSTNQRINYLESQCSNNQDKEISGKSKVQLIHNTKQHNNSKALQEISMSSTILKSQSTKNQGFFNCENKISTEDMIFQHDSVTPIIGEAIEEAVIYVTGFGQGQSCQTGNERTDGGETKEETPPKKASDEKGGSFFFGSGSVFGSLNKSTAVAKTSLTFGSPVKNKPDGESKSTDNLKEAENDSLSENQVIEKVGADDCDNILVEVQSEDDNVCKQKSQNNEEKESECETENEIAIKCTEDPTSSNSVEDVKPSEGDQNKVNAKNEVISDKESVLKNTEKVDQKVDVPKITEDKNLISNKIEDKTIGENVKTADVNTTVTKDKDISKAPIDNIEKNKQFENKPTKAKAKDDSVIAPSNKEENKMEEVLKNSKMDIREEDANKSNIEKEDTKEAVKTENKKDVKYSNTTKTITEKKKSLESTSDSKIITREGKEAENSKIDKKDEMSIQNDLNENDKSAAVVSNVREKSELRKTKVDESLIKKIEPKELKTLDEKISTLKNTRKENNSLDNEKKSPESATSNSEENKFESNSKIEVNKSKSEESKLSSKDKKADSEKINLTTKAEDVKDVVVSTGDSATISKNLNDAQKNLKDTKKASSLPETHNTPSKESIKDESIAAKVVTKEISENLKGKVETKNTTSKESPIAVKNISGSSDNIKINEKSTVNYPAVNVEKLKISKEDKNKLSELKELNLTIKDKPALAIDKVGKEPGVKPGIRRIKVTPTRAELKMKDKSPQAKEKSLKSEDPSAKTEEITRITKNDSSKLENKIQKLKEVSLKVDNMKSEDAPSTAKVDSVAKSVASSEVKENSLNAGDVSNEENEDNDGAKNKKARKRRKIGDSKDKEDKTGSNEESAQKGIESKEDSNDKIESNETKKGVIDVAPEKKISDEEASKKLIIKEESPVPEENPPGAKKKKVKEDLLEESSIPEANSEEKSGGRKPEKEVKSTGRKSSPVNNNESRSRKSSPANPEVKNENEENKSNEEVVSENKKEDNAKKPTRRSLRGKVEDKEEGPSKAGGKKKNAKNTEEVEEVIEEKKGKGKKVVKKVNDEVEKNIDQEETVGRGKKGGARKVEEPEKKDEEDETETAGDKKGKGRKGAVKKLEENEESKKDDDVRKALPVEEGGRATRRSKIMKKDEEPDVPADDKTKKKVDETEKNKTVEDEDPDEDLSNKAKETPKRVTRGKAKPVITPKAAKITKKEIKSKQENLNEDVAEEGEVKKATPQRKGRWGKGKKDNEENAGKKSTSELKANDDADDEEENEVEDVPKKKMGPKKKANFKKGKRGGGRKVAEKQQDSDGDDNDDTIPSVPGSDEDDSSSLSRDVKSDKEDKEDEKAPKKSITLTTLSLDYDENATNTVGDIQKVIKQMSRTADKKRKQEEEEDSDKKQNEPKVKKKKKRRTLLGLDIPDQEQNDSLAEGRGVRQSRRIAQIKIKEEAERRKVEEEITPKDKAKELKGKKRKIVVISEDEKSPPPSKKDKDEDCIPVKLHKKKRRKSNPKFDETRPWKSSSDDTSSGEEEEEHEEELLEYEEDPGSPLFKSDHEFSPESDLEEGETGLPLKRARTVKKEDAIEDEDIEDDTDCQKCGKSDHPEWILLCDGCDSGWHCSCLRPALLVIPEGDWYCPPCQHATLVKNLQEKLTEYDRRISKREIEVRRKERLAYVGISLDNVLPSKTKDESKDTRGGSSSSNSDSSESNSDRSSESESDSDEPIYQLRQRRKAHSYRFNDYDDLINSAIQEEIKEEHPGPEKHHGKDIANIINANEKNKDDMDESGVKSSIKTDEKCEDDDDEEIVVKKPKFIGRKKQRKLNSLDVSSEGEDSDEDFKGSTSDEDEDDFEESEGSSDSYIKKRPTRRSTRARTSRYLKDFINDDSSYTSSDDGYKKKKKGKKKKKKNRWDSDDSESISDSELSDLRSKKTKKRKQKRWVDSESELSDLPRRNKKKNKKKEKSGKAKEKKPMRRRIKYGGLSSDEGDDAEDDGVDDGKRRTRGKKINYVDVLGTDSDDSVRRKKAQVEEESEDEFVLNEEDNPDEEYVANSDDSDENPRLVEGVIRAGTKKGVGKGGIKRIKRAQAEEEDLFPPLEPGLETNTIEQINKNIESVDEVMMEEEEYANRQLQMVAQQLEKEKRRKELEAARKQLLQETEIATTVSTTTKPSTVSTNTQGSNTNTTSTGVAMTMAPMPQAPTAIPVAVDTPPLPQGPSAIPVAMAMPRAPAAIPVAMPPTSPIRHNIPQPSVAMAMAMSSMPEAPSAVPVALLPQGPTAVPVAMTTTKPVNMSQMIPPAGAMKIPPASPSVAMSMKTSQPMPQPTVVSMPMKTSQPVPQPTPVSMAMATAMPPQGPTAVPVAMAAGMPPPGPATVPVSMPPQGPAAVPVAMVTGMPPQGSTALPVAMATGIPPQGPTVMPAPINKSPIPVAMTQNQAVPLPAAMETPTPPVSIAMSMTPPPVTVEMVQNECKMPDILSESPKKRGRKPKQPGAAMLVGLPIEEGPSPVMMGAEFNETPPPMMLNPDGTPKKRRGRGKGKKTLEKEAAAAAAAAALLSGNSTSLPPPEEDDDSNIPLTIEPATGSGGKLGVAAAPQPFAQSQPKPSVITRMLQAQPPPNSTAPPGFPPPPQQSQPSQPPHKFLAESAPTTGGGRPSPPVQQPPPPSGYMSGPRGVLPPPSQGQFRPNLNHYPPPRAPPPSGIRPNHPHVFHPHPTHHPLDPSPSGGGQISPPTSTPGSSDHPPAPIRHLPPQRQQYHPSYYSFPPPEEDQQEVDLEMYPHSERNYGEEEPPNGGEEENGEFGGLVSYFSSQREDDLDT